MNFAKFLLGIALLTPAVGAAQQPVPTVALRPGLVLTHSARIKPGTYQIEQRPGDSAVVLIRGNDIVVDFGGAIMNGTRAGALPDAAHGVAIMVEGGRNVRIINARVHGYRIGLLARGTRGLSIIDSDFSRNWKPRLFSIIEHESLVDWLSHHHNEKEEWLRFGAGIYLSNVAGGEIRGNKIEHGMEGLMLMRCDGLRIWNNVIQFNSGVGIGLYRSTNNSILHNYAGFNVRGFSRYYRRGQDSADLLMYEQSSDNTVAYNSMTHGGDGLFLWSGQQTMDTGEGGSNDNHFIQNDFSYAPTNAMEATFSRNVFIGNKAAGSEHGLWGGYSYNSIIDSNEFGGNRIGIAIEHGQDNKIIGNRFKGDSTAISLWAIPEQPSDWAYPKHRDTRSRDYLIGGNTFEHNRVALRIANTLSARYTGNRFLGVDSQLVVRDTMTRVITQPDSGLIGDFAWPARMPNGLDPAKDPLARLDRNAIIVDEWGPYDWRTPKLWPADSTFQTPMALRVLGPAGTWHLTGKRGVAEISKTSGKMNDTIVVTPAPHSERDWSVTLADRNGRRFSWERFQPIAEWHVEFLVHDSVVARRTEPRLDYMWYRPTVPGVPQDSFRIIARAQVNLPSGPFTLRSISDDAVRVYLDDKLVIDDWVPHESKVDNAPVASGPHNIRVEYQQVDGWMELRVEIVRGRQTSTGSPGPH